MTKMESCQYICVFLPLYQDPHELNSGLTTLYGHFPALYLGAITHNPSVVQTALYKPTCFQLLSPL